MEKRGEHKLGSILSHWTEMTIYDHDIYQEHCRKKWPENKC